MKYLLPLLLLLVVPTKHSFSQDASSANLEVIYANAMDAIGNYQFDKALKLLSQCYIKDQRNILYINQIGYCHLQSGRYLDARLYYGETLKLDSTNITALSSLGSIYERQNNFNKALAYYQKLIAIDSTNSFYHKRAGYMCFKKGASLEAIGYFLSAHNLNEEDVEVINQVSSIYLQLGELDYAALMLEKGLYLDPNNIKLLHAKARLHQKKKEHEEVITYVDRAMQQGDSTDYYQMSIGVAYLQLDSLDQGIFHLESIVKREKDNEHTHHYLGVAYQQKDSIERSIEHYENAIAMGLSRKLKLYHSDLGSIYENQNDHKQAIYHFEKAFEYAEEPEFLFYLARNHDLYYKDKRMAMRYYEQYWSSGDKQYRDYTSERMEKLKEIIHFQR